MALILILCIFFTTVRHRRGFGQFEKDGDYSLFFINENKSLQVLVDGCPTGISGSGLLFVGRDKEQIQVDFVLGQYVVESRRITLGEPAQWILGPVGRPLFTVAREEALV